jgi:hypothetical protein
MRPINARKTSGTYSPMIVMRQVMNLLIKAPDSAEVRDAMDLIDVWINTQWLNKKQRTEFSEEVACADMSADVANENCPEKAGTKA